MTDAGFLRGLFGVLRGRTGRKLAFVLLMVLLALLGWWFLGRMPEDGVVEVRWTESPPAWVSVAYVDESGSTVRWRRESIRPGADRFRDEYRLSPGTYWIRVELRQGVHTRSLRKKVELPTVEPLVWYLEELEP